MDELFDLPRACEDLPFFRRNGGKNYIVVMTCTASAIMYHKEVVAKFGRYNAVVKLVLAAADRAKVTDPRLPEAQPETVIKHWCDMIKKDYECRNREIADVSSIFDQVHFLDGQLTK